MKSIREKVCALAPAISTIAFFASALIGLLFASRPSNAQVTFYGLVTAESPAWTFSIFGPDRFCLPFDFEEDEIQPVSKSPAYAFGSCSDALVYQAAIDFGQIVFDAETERPYEISLLFGTDAEYINEFPFPRNCDPEQLGLPPGPAFPCQFLAVRISETRSFWRYENLNNNVPFEVEGTTPIAMLPEPAFHSVFFLALISLLLARRRLA